MLFQVNHNRDLENAPRDSAISPGMPEDGRYNSNTRDHKTRIDDSQLENSSVINLGQTVLIEIFSNNS